MSTQYICPYCQKRHIDTTAAAPYVRGFLVIFQYGSKRFIGCKSCVRKKVLAEAGISSLIGWFIPKALRTNPFMILYNLIHAPFIASNPRKVRQKLEEAGIPCGNDAVDITRLGYSLATAMIIADGEVEKDEIITAVQIGEQIFPDFDREAFAQCVSRKDLPNVADIALILADSLDDEGKRTVCSYLWAIAQADGKLDQSEVEMLQVVMHNIGIKLQDEGEEEVNERIAS